MRLTPCAQVPGGGEGPCKVQLEDPSVGMILYSKYKYLPFMYKKY